MNATTSNVETRERKLLEAASALEPRLRTKSELLDELEHAIRDEDQLGIVVFSMSLRFGNFAPDARTPLAVIRGGSDAR